MWKDEMDVKPKDEAVMQYAPKTLNTGWVSAREAEPRDYNPFNPPLGGGYLKSSYKTIGCDWPDGTPHISETQEQMANTWKITKPKLNFRPLLNFLSYDSFSGGETDDGRQPYPPDYGTTDYSSTMKSDYRWYNVKPPQFVDLEEYYKPETKFRRIVVEGESQNINRNVKHKVVVKPPYALDADNKPTKFKTRKQK